MVVAIGNNRVKEGVNSGGISSGCSNDTWVIDPITAYGATDAASDLIIDLVILFL